MIKKIAAGVGLAVALVVAVAAVQAIDWGKNFNSFAATCAAMDGVLNGKQYGATCSFNGGVTNVPAGAPGWTVDVAEGTVATWLGGGKVTENSSRGTIVVACYDQAGDPMRLWQQHCALP